MSSRRSSSPTCIGLILIILFFWSAASPVLYPVTAACVTKENLITKLANPSNGILTYYLNVPAGKTVRYSVTLVPGKRTGSVDTVAGTCRNTGKKAVLKKISVKTKYYSNQYIVKAQYATGPSRNSVVYKDEDRAVSALRSAVISEKFVWTDDNIKKWRNGQRISMALTFAITGVADFAVTKGYLSGTAATILGVSFSVGNFAGGGTIASSRRIAAVPIKGWGYRIQLVPVKNGYCQYVIVYNDKGKIDSRYKLSMIPVSRISKVIK